MKCDRVLIAGHSCPPCGGALRTRKAADDLFFLIIWTIIRLLQCRITLICELSLLQDSGSKRGKNGCASRVPVRYRLHGPEHCFAVKKTSNSRLRESIQ